MWAVGVLCGVFARLRLCCEWSGFFGRLCPFAFVNVGGWLFFGRLCPFVVVNVGGLVYFGALCLFMVLPCGCLARIGVCFSGCLRCPCGPSTLFFAVCFWSRGFSGTI